MHPPPERTPVRLLIVEDAEDDARLEVRALERGGFAVSHERVESAAAMRDALARGGWDAVVADYSLPGFGGLAALEILRRAGLDIPFILVSGTIGEALAVEAMKAGASDYVMKKDLTRLAPALERELREAANRAARREVERALAEREERLRAIIATEPECVKLVSADGRLIEMNPAGLAMLEAGSLAEVQARPLLEYLLPEHRAAFVALHRRVMAGETGTLEFEVQGLKGGRRWLETHAAPLRDAQGVVAVLLGITRDVTARRLAERAAAAERARLRHILDSMRVFVALLSADGRMLDSNEAPLRFFGLSRERVLGSAFAEGEWWGPSRPQARAALARAAAGEAVREDFSVVGRGGEVRVFDATFAPLRDATGAVAEIVASGVDVTDRQRAEQAVREEQARLRLVADNVPAMIAYVDAQQRYRYANLRYRLFYGGSEASIDGRSMEEVLTPQSWGRTRPRVEQALRGTPQSYTGERRLHDGSTRYVSVSLVPHAGESGGVQGMYVLSLDVTAQHEAESALRESEARFRSLTELSADWYWEQDENFRFVESRPEEAARPEQADDIGKTRWEYVGADPRDPKWLEHRARLEKHLPFRDFEYGRRSRDGTWRHVAVSGMPVFDAQGRFRGYRGVGRDVTARRQAEERIRALNRVYAVLSGINALIVRARDREELFRDACRVAVEAGGLRFAWLGVVDEAAMRVRPAASAGVDEGFMAMASEGFSLRDEGERGLGIAARAIREARAQVVNDVAKEGVPRFRAIHAARGVAAVAAFPLVSEGRVIGNFDLHAAQAGFFDAEEVRLLGEVAGNIAFALDGLEHRRRLERTTRVNAIRSGINAAIVRIRGRAELLTEACRIAVQTGGLPFAWLCLVDEAGERLRPVATAGGDAGVLQSIGTRLSLRDDAPQGRGIAAESVRERRPMVVNDVQSDARILNKADHAALGIGAAAAFPLVVGGHATGTFVLHAADPGFFDDEEVKLLGEVAANIALALDHIDKEERVRRLTRVYAVLSGINALIVRARDREELFRDACRVAVQDGGFRMAWIGVVNRAAQRIEPVAWQGTDPRYIALMPLGLAEGPAEVYGLAGRAVNEKRPMISDGMAQDPRVRPGADAAERRLYSLALLPLLREGGALGVLALYASEADFFDADEMKLLAELAGDIAFAVDHIDKAEKADYLAYYDTVTGLANRSLLLERLAQELSGAGREGTQLALAIVNIERFKTLNDAFGRPAGDALLRHVGARLAELAGNAAHVARVGADHFALIVPDAGSIEGLAHRLAGVRRSLEGEAYRAADAEVRIATRAGVAVYPSDGTDAELLFRNAEAAVKKAAPGEALVFYEPRMTERVAERITLESKLRVALEREEFELHYQPKVELATRRILGLEALIRWRSPERGLVPPAQFIPLLEETGLILDAGAWVLRRAALDYRDWTRRGLAPPRVAVNVSPLQLRQADFVAIVGAAIGEGAAPAGVDLEITESLVMEDVEATTRKLAALVALGVGVAIDDFGTGYSSLGYLAKLPVQALKIDRSFISALEGDAHAATLVSTIISLAHSLRLKVVAEGVETEAQASLLRELRCDEAQGYLYGRPLPCEETAALLAAAP